MNHGPTAPPQQVEKHSVKVKFKITLKPAAGGAPVVTTKTVKLKRAR